MSDNKVKKIVFEPGCFDQMDFASQEELDAFVKEITEKFEGMTEEELMAQSQPLDLEALFEEDPEMAEALMAQLANTADPAKRKLQ